MDDSLFLPKDILEVQDPKKCFSDLRRSLLNLGRVYSESFDKRDPQPLKEYEKDIFQKLSTMGRSLGDPEYKIADDLEVEFHSNISIPMDSLLGQLDTFLTLRLKGISMSFDQSYFFGLTSNMSRYVVSTYKLSSDDMESLRSKGKYFVYNKDENDLFIFKKSLLPVVLKHLIYKGEDVELFYILKKMQYLLK